MKAQLGNAPAFLASLGHIAVGWEPVSTPGPQVGRGIVSPSVAGDTQWSSLGQGKNLCPLIFWDGREKIIIAAQEEAGKHHSHPQMTFIRSLIL